MPREIRHAIDDILEALNRVDQVSQGKTLADFEASWQLQYLVQRAIEIISEASRAIPDDLKALRPEIPWDSVKGIGNVLRHEYRGISNPLIWRVVTDELPRLRIAVEAIRDADATRLDRGSRPK